MKPLIIILLIGFIFIGGYFLYQSLLKPEKEEKSEYENTVIGTIDEQLKDLPMDQIRNKGNIIMEKSIEELQNSIAKGELTYTELTAFYLDRIRTYDKGEQGINAIIDINPHAIEEAKKRDGERSPDKTPLYGIPVLVKDNINTKDMVTTGGTYALKDFHPPENAAVINQLLKNKAIILGKTNLSELANYFDVLMPSGYSSKLGQTHNPFDPMALSPLGSSSGSGAAVAVNMAPVALGTETTGSIISPSYIHSIVGFKPTLHHISTEGVLPLSSTMDTVGPMGKNVKDVVDLYNASIEDSSEKITLTYTDKDLENKRIGVFKGEGSDILTEALKRAGAVPVELTLKEIDNEFIFLNDFRKDFAAYAKKYNLPVKTLEELVKFNEEDPDRRAKYGQGLLEGAAKSTVDDKDKVMQLVQDTQEYLKKLVSDYQLEAIAFINDWGILPPSVAGYPVVTIPMGEDEAKEPYGATFMALGGEDEKLLNLAYAFEQKTKLRLIPKKYKENK